jgi:recombination protein RecA
VSLNFRRIIEIFGPESSGKTTLALQVISQAQKQVIVHPGVPRRKPAWRVVRFWFWKGLKCLFIDVEHAMDASYAGELGVNIGDLLLAQPASGEEALEAADIFVWVLRGLKAWPSPATHAV